MAVRLSRTQIARHVSSELIAGNTEVVKQLAALLVDENRVSETDLILRSIYDELERDGIVVADVVSVRKLEASIHEQIKKVLGAKQLILNEQTDESVLGGVRISTPSRVLDATLRHRLTQLHERKV